MDISSSLRMKLLPLLCLVTLFFVACSADPYVNPYVGDVIEDWDISGGAVDSSFGGNRLSGEIMDFERTSDGPVLIKVRDMKVKLNPKQSGSTLTIEKQTVETIREGVPLKLELQGDLNFLEHGVVILNLEGGPHPDTKAEGVFHFSFKHEPE